MESPRVAVEKRAIRTEQAPTPTGPFNQAIRVGNLVFTADAQMPSDAKTPADSDIHYWITLVTRTDISLQ